MFFSEWIHHFRLPGFPHVRLLRLRMARLDGRMLEIADEQANESALY
jgi:hypothetical protein